MMGYEKMVARVCKSEERRFGNREIKRVVREFEIQK